MPRVERALAENPKDADTHTALANAYFLQYELTRPENAPNWALLECACAHAKRATELDPESAEAWATLGFVLTGAGDVEHARAAARHATTMRPGSWRHRLRLALACSGEQRLEAVDRTLALRPTFAPAYFLGTMVWVAHQIFHKAEDLAAKGAELQSRGADEDSAFPAFGLHWLLGLLRLPNGDVAGALASFDREITKDYREYRVNALLGKGHAHLAAGHAGAATQAFRVCWRACRQTAARGWGSQRAAERSGRVSEAESLAVRVHESVAELTKGGRLVEAAILRASLEAARGNAGAAADILERLLKRTRRRGRRDGRFRSTPRLRRCARSLVSRECWRVSPSARAERIQRLRRFLGFLGFLRFLRFRRFLGSLVRQVGPDWPPVTSSLSLRRLL